MFERAGRGVANGIVVLVALGSAAFSQSRTVVIFLIDGLDPVSAKTAVENGANNLKFIHENGVVVQDAYCPTPTPRVVLEDQSEPWGGTSGPNIAIHTGCHILESKAMDDIFLAAREKGVKSVFAGGATSYSPITTPDFKYAGNHPDEFIVQKGIDHFQKDNARLIRLHLQRIRDAWSGPADRTNPNSAYIKAVKVADAELGRLISALKSAGAWDSTYLIVASDHGMGNSSKSDHPATVLSSWSMFMGFYGPGIKRGETIPYAENPDIGTLTAHLLNLRPLKGHLDPKMTIHPKGSTGTLLTNIFMGNPRELNHPMPIYSYLKSTGMKPGGSYLEYRNGILPFLNQSTVANPIRGPVNSGSQKIARLDRGVLRYTIDTPAHIDIRIVNLQGKVVRSLVKGFHRQGDYDVNIRMQNGMLANPMGSGVYLVQFRQGNGYVESIPYVEPAGRGEGGAVLSLPVFCVGKTGEDQCDRSI